MSDIKRRNALDWDAIEKKPHRWISSEEALKDVVPIDWPEDVLNGSMKVVLTTPEDAGVKPKRVDKNCVEWVIL